MYISWEPSINDNSHEQTYTSYSIYVCTSKKGVVPNQLSAVRCLINTFKHTLSDSVRKRDLCCSTIHHHLHLPAPSLPVPEASLCIGMVRYRGVEKRWLPWDEIIPDSFVGLGWCIIFLTIMDLYVAKAFMRVTEEVERESYRVCYWLYSNSKIVLLQLPWVLVNNSWLVWQWNDGVSLLCIWCVIYVYCMK